MLFKSKKVRIKQLLDRYQVEPFKGNKNRSLEFASGYTRSESPATVDVPLRTVPSIKGTSKGFQSGRSLSVTGVSSSEAGSSDVTPRLREEIASLRRELEEMNGRVMIQHEPLPEYY
jgi:hypothetical protein